MTEGKMSLEEVRDWHRHRAEAELFNFHKYKSDLHTRIADAIDAHLASQPTNPYERAVIEQAMVTECVNIEGRDPTDIIRDIISWHVGMDRCSRNAEQPRGDLDKAIHAIDDLVALNGEEHDEAAWKLIRDRVLASQPKATTDAQVVPLPVIASGGLMGKDYANGWNDCRDEILSNLSDAVNASPAVATAGDGVPARFMAIGHAASDEIHRAANLLEKLPGRHANEAATIRTAVAYLREYGNETASPSAPRVGVPDEVIHRYLDAEGPLLYKPSFSTKPPSHAQQAEFARARDDLRKAMIAAAPEVPK